jgi:Spy/CpxP family protein refolding chaperone
MKKLPILLMCVIVVLSMTSQVYAQKLKEKYNSHKVAFLSQGLDLTEAQAQAFWPIYNAYQSEMQSLRQAQELNFNPNMTDKEAEALMESMLSMRTKEIEIQRRYIQKMKVAIPARKVALLFKLEREFNGKVVSKVKERVQDRKGR